MRFPQKQSPFKLVSAKGVWTPMPYGNRYIHEEIHESDCSIKRVFVYSWYDDNGNLTDSTVERQVRRKPRVKHVGN